MQCAMFKNKTKVTKVLPHACFWQCAFLSLFHKKKCPPCACCVGMFREIRFLKKTINTVMGQCCSIIDLFLQNQRSMCPQIRVLIDFRWERLSLILDFFQENSHFADNSRCNRGTNPSLYANKRVCVSYLKHVCVFLSDCMALCLSVCFYFCLR